MRNRERAETASLLIAAILALTLVALYVWRMPLLTQLTVEDGIVEYLTAGLFFVAALVFAIAGVRGSAPLVWVLPLALASFAVAGEEISWGQRLLGLTTPGGLADINVQEETNLHNIAGIHGTVRAFGIIVLLSLFVVLPLAVRHLAPARRLVARLRFPVPSYAAAAIVLIAILFMALPRLLGGGHVSELDESGEGFVAATWLVYAVGTWFDSRRDNGAPTPSRDGVAPMNPVLDRV